MVWQRIVDAWQGEPKLPDNADGQHPTRLPPYFPVEPKGCEAHAQRLFACLANEATEKARDMEKAGLHKSYFADVQVPPPANAEKMAELLREEADAAASAESSSSSSSSDNGRRLPKPGDNPLDECRSAIAYYQRCCDRELKKRKNWILTEPYRVPVEYRYNNNNNNNNANNNKPE
jgi:hypothetical protein